MDYMPLHAVTCLSSCGSIMLNPLPFCDTSSSLGISKASLHGSHLCCFSLLFTMGSNCKTLWRCLEVTYLMDSNGIYNGIYMLSV